MSPGADYLSRSRRLVDRVEAQLPEVRMAARWFSETILAGRVVSQTNPCDHGIRMRDFSVDFP